MYFAGGTNDASKMHRSFVGSSPPKGVELRCLRMTAIRRGREAVSRGNISPAIVVSKTEGRHDMYCNACGKAIAEDDRVCSQCGKLVGVPTTPKKLMRVRAEKKIAGVCAGMAQYFNLDVTLVRILWFFITVATGVCPGIVTYLLAWIMVPAQPEVKAMVAAQQPVTS